VRRSPLLPWLIALVGATSACGRGGEAPSEHVALVRTAKAGTGTITEWVRLYGRIVPPPDREADLAPQVAGILVEVPVREGQTVRAGSVVARVDNAPLDDAVRSAEAVLRRAEAEAAFRKSAAERTATLVDKGVASRQDAEADQAAAVSADAALAEATSALATARRRREWAALRAPFDGVIVRVHRRGGDSVDGTPATPVVQLAANTGIQVAAEATAELLVRIKPGQPAEVEAGDPRQTALQAHVLRVAQAVETSTGSGEVRLVFEGTAPTLPLGLGVKVRVAVGRRPDATIVPARALRRGEEGVTEVVVVEQGKAVIRKVTPGLAEDDRIELVSGVSPGETVVIDDPVGLADGMDLKERP
jgi:membrane fusion protein, multidrug efflux system